MRSFAIILSLVGAAALAARPVTGGERDRLVGRPGRAMALAFAAKGARLAIVGVNQGVIDEAAAMEKHGVSFGQPHIDLDALRSFKDGVVGKLTRPAAMVLPFGRTAQTDQKSCEDLREELSR